VAWINFKISNRYMSLQQELELLLNIAGQCFFFNLVISRTKVEKCDDDSSITSSIHEPQTSSCHDDHVDQRLGEKSDVENGVRLTEGVAIHSHHRRGCSSSILPEVTLPPIRADW
jgi:hypothetical protein